MDVKEDGTIMRSTMLSRTHSQLMLAIHTPPLTLLHAKLHPSQELSRYLAITSSRRTQTPPLHLLLETDPSLLLLRPANHPSSSTEKVLLLVMNAEPTLTML